MKLPQINYGGRAASPKGGNMKAAVIEAESRRGIVQTVQDGATMLAEVDAENKIVQAQVDSDSDLSILKRDYQSKETYTPDEIRDLGLDDVVPS